MTYQARVGDGDEVVLPLELAREMGFAHGEALVVERDGSSITIKPYSQVVREVQATVRALAPVPGGSVVDELLAERRVEAAREEAELEGWRHHRAV